MQKNKIVTIVLILLLVVVILVVKGIVSGNGSLVSPFLEKTEKSVVPSSSPFFNPPKEIKYDSNTDLKQELETVNPQVEETDFDL